MNPLVDIQWLAERLPTPARDPNLVVLDATLPPVGVVPRVDTRERYVEEHIPGAIFFDIDELSDHSTPLPHMLPTAEAFARNMSEMGVSDDSTIVVYERAGVFSAPRAWWMLRAFGAQKVHVLDGGLRSWVDAGLPTESGEVRQTPAKFNAKLDRKEVSDFAEIREMIAQHGQILDARSAGRFAGTAPEPRAGITSGHMPGAISLPFTELAENGRLKSAAQLQKLFRAKGVDVEKPVTTTCGSGVTAAVLALGLEIAGAKKVQLYDGSWSDYAQRPEAVIEKST
jgi:thiosulfate/3-mercaptopyruvate sulfurtransferase